MSDDGMHLPTSFALPPQPVSDGHEVVLTGDGPDPLGAGFLLVGGVLAPLPRRVRLPHEDDGEAAEDGTDEGRRPV